MIDIVIVNWNSGEQLAECVRSVEAYGERLVGRIVVVDNGSVDGSLAALPATSKLQVIETGKNLGFGQACNLAAAQLTSEFFLFLNPDARLCSGTLARALEAFSSDCQALDRPIGIVGVQLKDETDHIAKSCARFPHPRSMLAHTIGVDRIFPRLGYFMQEWDHCQTRQVEHVIGAFFLLRRTLFESLNGFDTRYFVYLEDLDFSYRAFQRGWSSLYLTEAQAFHAGGGSSRHIKATRLFYAQRSRIFYVFKHFSGISALLVLLATLLIEPFSRSAYALLAWSMPAFKETWHAYALLVAWLFSHQRARLKP